MEFNLLYLKYFLIIQCFSVSLGLNDGGIRIVRKNQPQTFECPLSMQEIKSWQIGSEEINRPDWLPVKTEKLEANVISSQYNVLNITLLSKYTVKCACKDKKSNGTKFEAIPIFNDNGNLYPSSETPNAIKDKIFTLKCNTAGGGSTTTWYTGNGTVIAKYTGKDNQNYSKYFGNRQETSCQNKICTLTITSVSLDEDNMSIICSSPLHASMFNITVFVLPKSVTIKATSDTVPLENQNKSYECLIKDTNPEFSVFWQITRKNGTQKNVTKYVSNNSSKSGKLTTLSSKLTLTLKKKFNELQCVAYFPGKSEFDEKSKTLDMLIKYSPGKASLKLNISRGKVCVDTPTKFQCSWKGGDPPANVTLMYKDKSNTSKEEVELNVTPSKSPQIVKCLGTHIAANVSREKNLTIYYPPEKVEIETDGPFLEREQGNLHCKAINGYPENYTYRWDPSNKTSENITLSQLNRTQNNEIYTCYAFNKCNEKSELYKKYWINVEYIPDITAPDNKTFIENQAANLTCSAEGNPIPEVRLECGNQHFSSNSLLTFNRKNASDVFCVANANSTKHGNLTSKKEIKILLKYPPQVNIHISNDRTIINCTAFDGNPATYNYTLEQKWVNATKNTYNKSVLPINNLSFNNTGTWECHVSNEYFQVSNSSNYKIKKKPIFSSTSNGPKIRNASNGESVTFKSCFYSEPKSDVKWQKNDELIDSNQYLTTVFISNEFPFKGNCTSLKIEDIKDNDFGTYTLTLENSEGKGVNTFTLRSKETTEIPLGIIIGCTLGILICIMLVVLAYKCHQRRAAKHNNEFSSTKAINTISGRDFEQPNMEDVHEVPNALYSAENTIELATEDIYANVIQKPNNVNDRYAKGNKPSKQTDDVNDLYAKVNKPSKNPEDLYAKVNKPNKNPEDLYAKVNKPSKNPEDLYAKVNKPSKKPEDVNDLYAKVNKPSKKPEDVNDLHSKVNKRSKKFEEDDSMNDNYEKNNQRSESEPIEECNYAELEFINNPGVKKPVPKPEETETIYAELL